MGHSLRRLFGLGATLLFIFFPALSASAAAIASPPVESFNSDAAPNCFPLGLAKLQGTTKPPASLKDWWCAPHLQYGFMGCVRSQTRLSISQFAWVASPLRFSYPLEDDDCSAASNSLAKMNTDFQRMKTQFGATMVRIYAPQCRDVSVWRNLLQAGIANNM